MVEHKKWRVASSSVLGYTIAKQDWIQLKVPIILAFIDKLHKCTAEGLVESLSQSVGLYD